MPAELRAERWREESLLDERRRVDVGGNGVGRQSDSASPGRAAAAAPAAKSAPAPRLSAASAGAFIATADDRLSTFGLDVEHGPMRWPGGI